MDRNDNIRMICRILSQGKGMDAEKKKIMIGFDGYVDHIYRVVKTRPDEMKKTYYNTIAEYGERIIHAAGKSADIDLDMQCTQPGGNAPLLADGVAALGEAPLLIGCLGYPSLDPCFQQLNPAITCLSYANPCQTYALEFSDGKIMMGDVANSEKVEWNQIADKLDESKVKNALKNADMVAVLNWSAHKGIPYIARMVSAETNEDAILFFDLSDPTSLSDYRLEQIMEEIAEIASNRKVVLGLNENEADSVFTALNKAKGTNFEKDMLQAGKMMVEKLHLACMFVHMADKSCGITANEYVIAEGFPVRKPLISTGGGDHYNAAFCYAYLHNMTLQQCLYMGNAAASYYVRNCKSPSVDDLIEYLTDMEGN